MSSQSKLIVKHLYRQKWTRFNPVSTRPVDFPQWNSSQKTFAFHCENCRVVWTPVLEDNCFAHGETCRNCGLMRHLPNNLGDLAKKEMSRTKKKSVNVRERERLADDSTKYQRSSPGSRLYESNYSSGDDNMLAIKGDCVEKIEAPNMPIKMLNLSPLSLVD